MTPRWTWRIHVASAAAVAFVFGFGLVTATSCRQGLREAEMAEGPTCSERGNAIIRKATSCAEVVAQLDELVRTDPSCRLFFGPDASSEQACKSDGGAK